MTLKGYVHIFHYRSWGILIRSPAQLNVLVDDSGVACITDFGLSCIRTDETLAYTMAATTVHGLSHHWAAPELLDDGAPSMASDVWALAYVYYEVRGGLI